jgi:short-subunit dehydrogenase
MVARGRGRVLNVASTAAFVPGPLMAVYYATKAYVLSFSEALANEVEGTGVTVTVLCPPPTKSGFQAAAQMEASRLVKGKRLLAPQAVAQAGYAGMTEGRRVVVPGFFNWLSVQMVPLVPRKMMAAYVRALQARAQT